MPAPAASCGTMLEPGTELRPPVRRPRVTGREEDLRIVPPTDRLAVQASLDRKNVAASLLAKAPPPHFS